MGKIEVNHDLYYCIPWPEYQKYEELDKDFEHTFFGDRFNDEEESFIEHVMFIEKTWYDKINNNGI